MTKQIYSHNNTFTKLTIKIYVERTKGIANSFKHNVFPNNSIMEKKIFSQEL